MKSVSQTTQFRRDVKRMRKRGRDLASLQAVIRLLAEGEPLPPRLKDHPLIGNWVPSRDCHVESDWILIYTIGQNLYCLSERELMPTFSKSEQAPNQRLHRPPFRRSVSLHVGIMRLLTSILICMAFTGCRQSERPEGQFTLSEILWVLDTNGTYHIPGSPEATHMLTVMAKDKRTQSMLNQKFSVFLLVNKRALQPDNPLGNPLIIAGEPATEELIGASNKIAARYFEIARTQP